MSFYIKHCGDVIYPQIRFLEPTREESERSVLRVVISEFFCSTANCSSHGRRILYREEVYDAGQSNPERIRGKDYANIIKRLRQAKQSDSVTGSIREKNSGKWIFSESIRV